MALAKWTGTVRELTGDVVPNALVTVRVAEDPGPGALADLWADRDGSTPLANPFSASAQGRIEFFTLGGSYKITAQSGAFASELDFVGVGTGNEIDAEAEQVAFDPTETGVSAETVQAALDLVVGTVVAVTALVLTAGAGLTGGGDLSAPRTFDVGAGTGITVNANDVALDTAHVRNVDHSGVTLTAGAGLTGGGDISANRTFDVVAGTGITVNANDVALDTASTLNTDHTGVTLTAGAGLTGGGDISANRTFTVGAGTGIVVNADDVAVDKATDANIRAAASNKVVTSDLVESASAFVALTDAATVAVDWDTFIAATLVLTTTRTLGNPTNGQPGTWRSIYVTSDGGPDTLAFGNQYIGPAVDGTPLSDIQVSVKSYLVVIMCLTTSLFLVTASPADLT